MNIRLLLAASALAAISISAAAAEDKIATVNGKAISKAQADIIVAAQTQQGQKDDEHLRKAVREELINREVLAQEAARKGVDKKPEVLAQMSMARQGVLVGAYLQEYVRSHPITEDAIKKEYDTIRATLHDKQYKEYKVRHVLVDSEAEAKDIIARLNKGESFDELAKVSKDPGSKDKGGSLGWVANPGNVFVKPFADALLKLEKGKYTDAPVKSDFGWHVIELEDVREAPPLENIRGQIAARLQQQLVEKHIASLVKAAKVE